MDTKRFPKTILFISTILIFLILTYLIFIPKAVAPQPVITNQNTATTTATPSLPNTCTDDDVEGVPVITSLSSYSGSIGAKLEINGCNFSGFEGDKNIWIENSQGTKGIMREEIGSTGKIIIITLKSLVCQKDTSYSGLPCDGWLTLNPGPYKIYTTPWGRVSNKVDFTIK